MFIYGFTELVLLHFVLSNNMNICGVSNVVSVIRKTKYLRRHILYILITFRPIELPGNNSLEKALKIHFGPF